ncbi:MAG: MFS transporter [Desulfobacterales bacterium]|nr:MFS transporter [Desulfobacterales bacterium]
MEPDNQGEAVFAIGAQYFLYFGVLGIFLPYFNLYCYHLGFSGFQIGLLSGLRSVTLVIFSLVWAALADRLQNRKAIYVFCSAAAAAVWTLYLTSEDFGFLLLVTMLYGIFFAPIISFLEAFTMDALNRDKRRYGQIRAWGSVSFILTVLVMGWIIDAYGIRIILMLILMGGMAQAAGSVAVPRTSRGETGKPPAEREFLVQRRTVVFMVCAFLMLVSHGTYYGFFSIHLDALGYGKTFIGTAWALASTAEILAMVFSERLFRRFSLESVLAVSFGVAALRWFLLAQVTSLPAILATQVLHALTYGTFHMASILFMDRLTPDGSKTLGQAVNNAIQYGLGLMAGFFFNGWLYETVGSFGLFAISGAIALVALVLFLGLGRVGEDRSPEGRVVSGGPRGAK